MNKFLQISLGVSAMLLSGAFLIKSIQPAHAEVAPMKQLTSNAMASGKYMMNQACVYNAEGTTVYHYVLVWDTETGKSRMYWFDRTDKKTYEWEQFGKDLPAVPL
jgi:uncharacterized membrane protein